MQQYKRPEAIKRMNELAGSRKPFLFIIDYKQQCSLIEEISRIDSTRCRYNFNGVKNVDTVTESYSGQIDWNFVPMSLTDYRQAFEIVKRNILAGNSYLANLTCKVPVSTNLTLEDVFRYSKALYRLWLKDKLVCFSPEIFVRIEDGEIKSFPMKGTIDATLPNAEKLLMDDPKETAEHATIVDLIRNDLLPAGSITGAPKSKTMDIIEEAENYERGFYTGIMGYCDGRTLDSAVMIRFLEQEGENLYYKAGGGITSKSDLQSEYNEMIQKIYVPIY